ncbi:MAG TPA: hypothetical protein VIA18_10960 [Polyangia bacterium]|jgi:hypothetical protein|nr:hypothetical protein [Polyangia bacterium]
MKLMLVGALVFALLGCAPPPSQTHHVPRSFWTIGRSHNPYHGKPAYLAEARPLVTVNPAAPRNDCLQRSLACDQRLRATLAALDGQLLALSTPPTDVELEALELSANQLDGLLVPFPDLQAEQHELKTTLPKLAGQPLAEQTMTRKRLIELSDLLRLQLAASQ